MSSGDETIPPELPATTTGEKLRYTMHLPPPSPYPLPARAPACIRPPAPAVQMVEPPPPLRAPLMPNVGTGKELREHIERVLVLPENMLAFSLHFRMDEPLIVTCEFRPLPRDPG